MYFLSRIYFPTIFCIETKLVLFCHHSPIILIRLSHFFPSNCLISCLFWSTLILCFSVHSKWPQKACQYSTLLRLFLLCNVMHNATCLLRKINGSNITNCTTCFAFQESDLQNTYHYSCRFSWDLVSAKCSRKKKERFMCSTT